MRRSDGGAYSEYVDLWIIGRATQHVPFTAFDVFLLLTIACALSKVKLASEVAGSFSLILMIIIRQILAIMLY